MWVLGAREVCRFVSRTEKISKGKGKGKSRKRSVDEGETFNIIWYFFFCVQTIGCSLINKTEISFIDLLVYCAFCAVWFPCMIHQCTFSRRS